MTSWSTRICPPLRGVRGAAIGVFVMARQWSGRVNWASELGEVDRSSGLRRELRRELRSELKNGLRLGWRG
jgi:hypothetical protein